MAQNPQDLAQKSQRLQQVVNACSWWLMAQGALLTLMGQRLSDLLRLRFQDQMAPYINLAGLSLLCLGLFINRAVREASKQYLAIDTLVLFFFGLSSLALSQRLRGNQMTWFEWLSLGLNIGLGVLLVLWRTRGSQMQAPGSLVAMDALDALRQAKELAGELKQGKMPQRAPAPTALAEPTPSAELEPQPAETVAPKKVSEAVPHMD